MDRAQELGERVSSARREPGLERSSSFFSRRRWVHLRVHVCYADATAAVFSKRVANVQQWCIFYIFGLLQSATIQDNGTLQTPPLPVPLSRWTRIVSGPADA